MLNSSLILEYLEIRPSQLLGENPEEIALRAYISHARDLARGDIPIPEYSVSVNLPQDITKKQTKNSPVKKAKGLNISRNSKSKDSEKKE